MAFESLSEKLQNIFKALRGKGKLSEADVKLALKEVRMALLEADVNFKVVKKFISDIQERAIGAEVLGSLRRTDVHDQHRGLCETHPESCQHRTLL